MLYYSRTSGRTKPIPIGKTKRCKAIVFRKGQMFQAGDTEAEAHATIACLSSYLRKGESDCLERDRREAVSFLLWLRTAWEI